MHIFYWNYAGHVGEKVSIAVNLMPQFPAVIEDAAVALTGLRVLPTVRGLRFWRSRYYGNS